MTPHASDRLQGTLDLLVLRVLQHAPMHGWGIAQQIQLISRDVLQVNQGSLYPALRRLEERGWIEPLPLHDRRRPYKLTSAGRAVLKARVNALRAMTKLATSRLANA